MGFDVETSDYRAAIAALQAFDKDLEKGLSKRISAAARPVVVEMRREVMGIKSGVVGKGVGVAGRGGGGSRVRSDYAVRNVNLNLATAAATGQRVATREQAAAKRERSRSLRESVARGVRLSNVKKGRGAGVVIRTSGTYLPPDQKRLPKRMNRGSWRHPVFGNRDVWVEQIVDPPGWFDEPAKRSRPKLSQEVSAALDEAVKQLPLRARRGL